MDVVLIHLGGDPPPYIAHCILQVMHVTGRDPIVILPEQAKAFSNCAKVKQFRELDFYRDFGLNGFWRYACERFFILEETMKLYGMKTCLHIENDNMLYIAPDKYQSWLVDMYGDRVAITPVTALLDTAAVMYVGSVRALQEVNEALLFLMSKGPDFLKHEYGPEMLNEMRLLNIIRTTELAPLADLPVLPGESDVVFDPASYGQWFDGIPFNPGVRHAEERHIVGNEILHNRVNVEWNECHPTANGKPLANLHIHSKRLGLWATK